MSRAQTDQSKRGRTWAFRARGLRALVPGSLVFGGVAVASVIAGSQSASAAPTAVPLYVAVGGTGDCTTLATACGSIQTAITTAETKTGDDVTINVALGTYTENDTIDASTLNSLTIAGAGASTTTVNGNQAGTVFGVGSGTVTISGLTENGKSSALSAQGISNDGTLTVNSSTVSNNEGAGGIFNASGGTLTLNSSTVSGNSVGAGFGGGGISNDGTLTLNSSTVSGNTAGLAAQGGGGIRTSGGTLTLNSSTVSGNTDLGHFGGGIYNQGGTLTLNSSTVSGNTANGGGVGGGIFNVSTMTLNSSTVSGNTAGDGGGLVNNAGSTTLDATIVAANTDTLSLGPNCFVGGGSVTSDGYNLTDDATGTACGLNASTDKVNVSPDLGPLADNGGPTLTQLPGAGSPAIGAIPSGTTLGTAPSTVTVCPRTDQRGVASDPGFNCTIGAVEVLPTGTLSGHIYLCSGATPTTTEESGGTLGATGPQSVSATPNPLGPSTVEAGTYTMTATAPMNYQLSACGSTTNSATQTVAVPQGGAGGGVFYVTPLSPCAAGLTAHTLSATYAKGTFSGLFCVNATGVGTYTQGTVTGIGWVTTVRGTTVIAALGKNLALAGFTNGTKSGFFELAPAPFKIGTFTLS